MTSHIRPFLFIIALFAFFSAAWQQATAQTAAPEPLVTVFAEGFRNPVGLAQLADGTLLIAEEGTGKNDFSAGVSIITPAGEIGRLVSEIRSGRDSGDLSGVALVAVSPDEETLYIGNFAQGHLWTLPIPADGLALPVEPYTPDDLGKAMEPLNRVTLTNPFDMTFDADGVPVVADASQNGVATELPSGQTSFIHRFDELIDPSDENLRIDAVPTGIERIGAEYYVTLTGGCPYPQGGGELVAIDGERNQRTVIDNLNMPIDVAQAADGTIYVLEFAQFSPDGSCFSGSGYLPNSGRLSRIADDGALETVVENLNFPGAVLPLADGSLLVSEIFDGEIVQIQFDEALTSQAQDVLPQLAIPQPQYNTIADADAALRTVIDAAGLQPQPGADVREGDTELAALGRDLFFDPILSGDQNISCASCHHPAFAMTDRRVLPIGSGGVGLGPERDYLTHITLSAEYSGQDAGNPGDTVINPAIGQFVPRNSPTILNSALLPVQFWDGRVRSYALGTQVTTLENGVNGLQLTDILAAQALFPVISRAEMAGATFGEDLPPQSIRDMLVARLEATPAYDERFRELFGEDEITAIQIVEAIAAFERQLIFTDAPWDQYIAGDTSALSDQQKRGALLFYGQLNDDVNCAACHSGDLLTDLDFHNLLVPQLGPGKGNGISGREDWGRANVSFDWRDRFRFRTPSLRNVELTAPYFHSGAYETLDDTIWHHANIWESAANYDPSAHLPQEFYSSLRPFDLERQRITAAPELANGLPLTDADVADLVAFLESLTDPAATDLMHLSVESVPSGLPLDDLPQPAQSVAHFSEETTTLDASESDDVVTEGWRFVDVSERVGLRFQHQAFQYDLYEDPAAMMGAGLCWIDYDNDGWLDLYLINSYAEDEYERLLAENRLPTNRLYRNQQGQFVDVSERTQTAITMRGNGCVAADFNRDGWSDLYITADEANQLLLNTGDGRFVNVAASAGVDAPEWSSAAAVADINGDGWQDLFVGSYIDLENKIPNPMGAFPQDYYGLPDRLYLSNGLDAAGNLSFTEVTREVGIVREERALGAIFTDADRDGDLDLYIANDGQPNRMYENIPTDDAYGFRMVDLTDTASVGDAGSGMGVTSGDYDGDGYFDLMVTNWEAELNALYRNETGDSDFINYRYSTYRIGMRGLGNDMTGWGTRWADFDHDTDLDLLTVNGRVPISNWETDPELVRLYGNYLVERGRPHYLPWTERVGLDAVGALLARGSAVADYDNDGDLDIAINVINGDAVLLANEGITANWLTVTVPDFAPGTVVTATLPDGRQLVREWHAGSSYLASEDPRFHFGLGDAAQVMELVVQYPDGTLRTFADVAANQFLTIR